MNRFLLITPVRPPDTTPPSVPTIVGYATKNATSVTLTFTGSTDDRSVAGYEFSANSSALPGSYLSSPATVVGLNPGTTYGFKIRAFDQAGNRSSYSSEVAIATDGTYSDGNPYLSLSAVNSSTINVSIFSTPNSNATVIGFELERSLTGTSGWTSVSVPRETVASLVPAVDTRPPTKYVSASGTLNGNSAYTTIQAAINAASPGDIIAVGAGTYVEKVAITTANVYVRAWDVNNKPTVDGQYSLPGGGGNYGSNPDANLGPYPTAASFGNWAGTEYNNALLMINANNVTWDGIHLKRSHQSCIMLGPLCKTNGYFVLDPEVNVWKSNISIFRCDVFGARGSAVIGQNIEDIIIAGCRFRETGSTKMYDRLSPVNQFDWGNIISVNSKRFKLYENDFFQSIAEGLQAGVQTNPAGLFLTVYDFEFKRNRVFDTWSSNLYMWNVNGGDIEGNIFYMTNDTRFWHYGASGYPSALFDFGSESAQYNLPLSSDGYIGSKNIRIKNNIFMGAQELIKFSQWEEQLYDNIEISNNIFCKTVGFNGYRSCWTNTMLDGYDAGTNTTWHSLQNVLIQNNITYDVDGNISLQWNSINGTYTKRNNIWSHTPPSGLSGTNDIITISPGLVNASYTPPANAWPLFPDAFDATQYGLQANSVAVNYGYSNNNISTDLFGRTRPLHTGKIDVGPISLSRPNNAIATDTSLSSGTMYYYRVRFTQSDQYVSPYSTVVSVNTP